MKKLIGITIAIAAIAANQSFAQNKTTKTAGSVARFDEIRSSKEAEGLIKLKGLAKYGSSNLGQYPLCEDVINIRNFVAEGTIAQFFNEFAPQALQAFTSHKFSYDINAFRDRLTAGSDGLSGKYLAANTSPPQKNTGSSSIVPTGGACFTGETNVTLTQPHKNQNFSWEINFEDLNYVFESNSYDLHVLSSPVESIPDAPADYLLPCWGKINGLTVGELYDKDDSVCTITYGDNGHAETCTPKHRFRVEVCDASGKATGCEWKPVSEIDSTKMNLISDSGQPVKISSVTTKVVEDWDGGWLLVDFDTFSDLDVYNLSVETGTYYVGTKGNRVLVHNVKP